MEDILSKINRSIRHSFGEQELEQDDDNLDYLDDVMQDLSDMHQNQK